MTDTPFYSKNQERFARVSEDEWKVALHKSKIHIKWRLKQKMKRGAHSSINLGGDPVDHYLGIGYEKLLAGEWEWKEKFTLSEQMIRVIDSYITKEVNKYKTKVKNDPEIVYDDDLVASFYDTKPEDANDEEELAKYNEMVSSTERAVQDDYDLAIFWECIKEGKKREQIAEILEKKPKQVDKLREKLFQKAREIYD